MVNGENTLDFPGVDFGFQRAARMCALYTPK
jgi:hypothetical protein